MPCIARGQQLVPAAIKREQFPLPECGEGSFLWLRSLTSQEVVKLTKEHVVEDDSGNPTQDGGFALIALSAVDDEGRQLFSDAADVKANLNVQADSIVGMVRKIMESIGGQKKS